MGADRTTLAPPASARVGRHERWFGAMGTTCHVVVLEGTESTLIGAEDEVRRLERLWSRFRRDSEISRLNAAEGAWVRVHPDTVTLLEKSADAWHRLGGWFDPFMQRELVAAGYDRDIHLLTRPGGPAPSCPPPDRATAERDSPRDPLELDSERGRARLHGDVGFDPGGLGKGLAADMVSRLLVDWGATGALVNLGGDLRAVGEAPTGGWRVSVDDPFHPTPSDPSAAPVAVIGVTDSGLCTSTTLRRRWWDPTGRPAHHVLDPRTGRPAATEIASMTVTAATACEAESLATAVMLAGPSEGKAMLEAASATALVVHLDRRTALL